MNILYLTLLYHPDDIDATLANSHNGLQNQINSYQWALMDGLEQNLRMGETITIVNTLPVGIFPTYYRKLVLPSRNHGDTFREVGCLNLPWFKQWMRTKKAEAEIERWYASSPDNRTLLLYTLYLPYMQAIEAVKRRHSDVKSCVIVTDLPNALGISSGRRGLLRRIEYTRGEQSMALSRQFDGFVLLTAPMAEALGIEGRSSMVLEGLVSSEVPIAGTVDLPDDSRPVVLYTGTLNRELGIGELLQAFRGMKEAQLWLCGRGDMESEIRQVAGESDNIRYFGFVPQATALALQANADALINPRTSQGIFTRYSFPSKTLEYMRSGKPVICCNLEGIPDEYDAFLRYIEPQNVEGIRAAVQAVLALSVQEREAMGQHARTFALTQKNSKAQCARLLMFLRRL